MAYKEIIEKNIIEIRVGQEHELASEQDITDPSLMMHPAYQFALSSLRGILNNSDRYWDNDKSNKNAPYRLYGYSNNIIAFNAHRGQGKTSAMLSFANALDNTSTKAFNHCRLKNPDMLEDDRLKNRRFVIIPPIDPTMLSQGERIVNLFLSWLIEEIYKLWKETGNLGSELNEQEKKHILDCVIECKKYLSSDKSNIRNRADDWEDLDALEDSFRIKENLCQIIQHYLKLRQWERNEGVLVIQVDDTDMQLNNAYQILEDLRRYLTLPNTVVLMATYLWQLRVLVAQQFASEMGVAIANEYTNKNKISRIAAKYIDKLFPATNTVHLPTLKIQKEHERLYLRIVSDNDKPREEEMEQLILRMIYEKTGLAFISHKTFMHYIIPSTLRGFVHLFRLLNEMDEIPMKENSFDKQITKDELLIDWSERSSSIMKQLKNLELFEQYFMEDWCPSRISDDKRELINRIDDAVSPRRVELALSQLEALIGPAKTQLDITNTARSLLDISATLRKEEADISVVKKIDNLSRALNGFLHDNKESATKLTHEVFDNLIYDISNDEQAEAKHSQSNASAITPAASALMSSISKVMLQHFQDTALNSFPKNYEGLIKGMAVYEQKCSNDEDFRFIFALRTYFSIQFNKQMLNATLNSYSSIQSSDISTDGIISAPTLVDYYGTVFESTPTSDSWDSILDEIAYLSTHSKAEESKAEHVAIVSLLAGKTANTLVELMRMKEARTVKTDYLFAYVEFIQYLLCNWDILFFICDKFDPKEELPHENNRSGNIRTCLNLLIKWLCKNDVTKNAMDRIIPGIMGDSEMKNQAARENAIDLFVTINIPAFNYRNVEMPAEKDSEWRPDANTPEEAG